jgi:hypothetical protein
MSDLLLPRIDDPISRRSLLRGGVAAALLAALPSCDSAASPASTRTASRSGASASAGVPNVRVSHDSYGVHIEPSLAANSRNPRQLLAVCQASSTPNPEFIATYLSFDGGASWQNGGLPPKPSAAPDGDDLTVTFDSHGRGHLCATRAGHVNHANPADPNADRAVYVWRTDDGGRTFSAPMTLVQGQYCDHPWLATGRAGTSSRDNVYVAWGAGGSHTALELRRSTDGGESFEPPRRILPEARIPSLVAAGPALATGPAGLVCAVCDWTTQPAHSGDLIGQVVAVCSTDAGHSFAAPVHLGSESSVIALPGGDVRANSTPAVAASPRGHALYVAFVKRHPSSSHSDIVVTASHDRGRTWSKPVTATPADEVTYFQPNLAVDETGRVGISAFALANGRVDEVLLLSPFSELRFQPPLRVTTAPFDPHSPTTSGGKHGAWWIGGYQGLTSSAGAFHLVWNDTRTGKLDLFGASVRP